MTLERGDKMNLHVTTNLDGCGRIFPGGRGTMQMLRARPMQDGQAMKTTRNLNGSGRIPPGGRGTMEHLRARPMQGGHGGTQGLQDLQLLEATRSGLVGVGVGANFIRTHRSLEMMQRQQQLSLHIAHQVCSGAPSNFIPKIHASTTDANTGKSCVMVDVTDGFLLLKISKAALENHGSILSTANMWSAYSWRRGMAC